MTDQELRNFSRMANAFEEEIFRLRKEAKENNALVEIMQRELHDARLELRIAKLELEVMKKSAKFDDQPWDGSEDQLEESIWLHNVYSVGHR